MKTIEQKAKAYDDALQVAKNALECEEQGLVTTDKVLIEKIFPELKESEDEKWIPKEIAEYLKEKGGFRSCWLAWLEKQGKKESDPLFSKMKEAGYEWDADRKELRKIKSKFHKGEWVTNGIETVQITGYDIDYGYQVDYKGNLQHRDTDVIEKEYHLWTIQDAKSGDVLVDKYNNIGIYKEIEGIYWDSYIYLGCDGKLYDFSVGGMHDQTQTHPATKGQRDNLLKAMAEAGWDFDFEKKELKKIKPIDEYEGLTDYERAVADACIGFIGKEIGWKQYIKDNADNLLKIAVKKFNAVQDDTTIAINNEEAYKIGFSDGEAHAKEEMTSAWSEDDESVALGIEQIVNCASLLNIAPDKLDKVRNWLKSIKERVACEANCTTAKYKKNKVNYESTREDLHSCKSQ